MKSLVLLALSAGNLIAQPNARGQNLAPFVASPQEIIDLMLESAGVKPGEIVYDLGCGDGRIVVTAVNKFRAKAVGVELNPELARAASDMIFRLGLQNRATILRANMMDVDISPADVVTLYLLTSSNEMLRPKLEKSLKPGARVVSHDYAVRGWKPVRVDELEVHGRTHKIYLYRVIAAK
jgi:precorrin-6B methylase 2